MNVPTPTSPEPDPSMQILLLAPQPFFQERGTPIAVRMLSVELANAGNEVDLLVFHEGQQIDLPGVTVHRTAACPGLRGVKPGFSCKKLVCDLLMLVKSIGLIRKKKYDMIHAVEEAAFIALLLQFFFDIPYVYDMDSLLSMQLADQMPILSGFTRLMERFECRVMRRSRGVLAVCRSLEEKVRQMAPQVPVVRLEDVSLLDAATDSGEDIRAEYGIDGCVFMYVGNLEKYQGIDLLLEAFALSSEEERQHASLVIIGGREMDIKTYRDRSKQLGVAARVHFIGPRPVGRLGQFLRQADILVSPRIQGNNTPMKIYSYLDSGRPVLATRLATHTQVLDDDISMLAEPTAPAFMEAMRALRCDPERRQRLARAAGERVRQEYSREAFRVKLQRFYTTVAATIGGKV